jgi:hypothetical protein
MRTAITSILFCLVLAAPTRAGDTGAVVGSLLGAAAGLVLSDQVGEIHPVVSVPVLALAGGSIGRELDRDRDARRRPAPRLPRRDVVQPERTADLQPGVDLVKVSIRHSNGIRTDIPILRTGGTFIGPRGERYDALPSSEVLRRAYGM